MMTLQECVSEHIEEWVIYVFVPQVVMEIVKKIRLGLQELIQSESLLKSGHIPVFGIMEEIAEVLKFIPQAVKLSPTADGGRA